MNLTDVVAELDARAREVRGTPAEVRLAGVRRRRRLRRARAVAGVVAVGVAAGVAGLAVLPDRGGDRAVQPAWQVSFDPDDAGDPLVAQARSRDGGLDLRVTPRDTDLALAAYCVGRSSPSTYARILVNGKGIGVYGCSPDDGPGTMLTEAEDAAGNRAGWAEFGLVPGRESRIQIRLEGGAGVDEVGVALYERSGPRVVSDGVTLRRMMALDGRTYRLVTYRTKPLAGGGTPLVTAIPPGEDRAGVVLAGLAHGPTDGNVPTSVVVDGEERQSGAVSGVVTLDVPTRPGTVSVAVGGRVTGTLITAYYLADR